MRTSPQCWALAADKGGDAVGMAAHVGEDGMAARLDKSGAGRNAFGHGPWALSKRSWAQRCSHGPNSRRGRAHLILSNISSVFLIFNHLQSL
jgi:hypothetical protein